MLRNFKTIILSAVLLYTGTATVFAKDDAVYNVALIKPQLLENAEAVVRVDEQKVEIVSLSKMLMTHKFAVTILKESAVSLSKYSIPYDKHSKVGTISVTVFDKNGVKVKKLKPEEILDVSDIDDGTIYSDSRRKLMDPRYQNYPFTVEYDYSITHETTAGFPDFSPFWGYNVSTEKSSLAVTCPTSYKIRYMELNGAQTAKKESSGNKTTYTWSETDFISRNKEPFAPSTYETFPYVMVEPSTFELDGYKGDCSTWQSFGSFEQQLIVNRDKLPEATVQKLKDLVKDCPSDYEKVKKIYEYSQKKNRYISIQVGIGGLQPFEAETVDRLSYGDCKALSNYIMASLKAVGINSHYTAIQASDIPRRVFADFTANRFNHVVLCVPLPNDTVWLECTNPHIACGYFGESTHNRMALLIDGENSRLVKTPALKGRDNLVCTHMTASIYPNGHAKVEMRNNFGGIHYGKYIGLNLMDETDRKKTIIKLVTFPNFQLNDYKITEEKSRKPHVSLQTNLDVLNMTTQMGARMVLKLNQHNQQTYIPPFARKREADLLLVNDHVESDSVEYILPQGYTTEGLPEPVHIETIYGSYTARCEASGDKLLYFREFEIKSGRHKPDSFNQFRDFLEKVAAADNAKCFLVKK